MGPNPDVVAGVLVCVQVDNGRAWLSVYDRFKIAEC